ncbi:hypothetical protein Scep_001540 [Stephania cephalantha]|uniref:Uncharacterized protein n=1 Tax=Stephania cephalantha TaxID=152367 RepID=A0AAP0LC69_9MAGN
MARGEKRAASAAKKGPAVVEKVASGGENVGQRRKQREPAAAEKGGRGGAMLGPMASAFTRGDQQRRRRRPRRDNHAQRWRDPRCRRRALQRNERAGGVAVDVDDDSRRRRRWWWRGLCGGGEGFRWQRRRQKGFAERGDEEDGTAIGASCGLVYRLGVQGNCDIAFVRHASLFAQARFRYWAWVAVRAGRPDPRLGDRFMFTVQEMAMGPPPTSWIANKPWHDSGVTQAVIPARLFHCSSRS